MSLITWERNISKLNYYRIFSYQCFKYYIIMSKNPGFNFIKNIQKLHIKNYYCIKKYVNVA